MRSRHLIRRGNRYTFVCRVPSDLSLLFPSKTIWKSLKAESEKDARILASAEEYRAQKLFVQLRSGMLPKELERRLVAEYLKPKIEYLEGHAKDIKARHENLTGPKGTLKEYRDSFTEWSDRIRDHIKEQIADGNTSLRQRTVDRLAEEVKKSHNIKMSDDDKESLSLELLKAEKTLREAGSSILQGEWSPMDLLKEKVERDLATPYVDLKTALEKYQEWYLSSKPNVKPGTKDDMTVECRVLLEICGNISISEFNEMDTVTKVKRILQRYPKNKVQRYSDKSIHTIIKNESGYEVINLKTANEYLKRAKAVVEYAGKERWITTTNVWNGELFATERAAEEQRLPYGNEEIERLVDALCTQPLWRYNPPKPERFWIVLIALFQGLRLGNIVALSKADICQLDNGLWVFRLRKGKTKATVRPVAICDVLLLLGFLEWVDSLKRDKLFQDDERAFSKWYNRDEMQGDREVLGFEASYITRDKKKCLYSLRHSFAGNVFEVTGDIKIAADMMGHSTENNITTRYTKATKARVLKEMMEKMSLEGVDLDRLEARAQELFFDNAEPST